MMATEDRRGVTLRCEVFLAALDDPKRAALGRNEDLGGWIDAAIDAGGAAWPGVALPDDLFLTYLAEKVCALPDPTDYRALHTTDLILACACLHHCPGALAAFAERYGASMARAMARGGVCGAAADELVGALREKLFFGSEARIAKYSGRGQLGGWARAVAHNAAANESVAANRHVDLDEAFDAPGAQIDPELGYLKSRYSGEFRTSLAHAVEALSGRDRTLLRQHHIDGSTVDELGRLHGVHRATAAQWLVRAREVLARELRKDLAGRLHLSARELDSLLRMLRSDVRGSVTGIL